MKKLVTITVSGEQKTNKSRLIALFTRALLDSDIPDYVDVKFIEETVRKKEGKTK
jgi:hypothetical protein